MNGELTISTCREWRDHFVELLAAGGCMTVDLSGVDRCDTAGLQLLTSLRRSAAEQGIRLDLASAPPCVLDLANSLGLSRGAEKVVADGV